MGVGRQLEIIARSLRVILPSSRQNGFRVGKLNVATFCVMVLRPLFGGIEAPQNFRVGDHIDSDDIY